MNCFARISRLPLPIRALAPILLFVVALPVFAFWLIDKHMSTLLQRDVEKTLSTATATLENLKNDQTERFIASIDQKEFREFSRHNSSDLMNEYLRKLMLKLDGKAETLLYTPTDKRDTSEASRSAAIDLSELKNGISSNIEHAMSGEANSTVHLYSNIAYHIISVPIFVKERIRPIGTLSVAIEIGEDLVSALKTMTQAEVMLLANLEIIATTLPEFDQLPSIDGISRIETNDILNIYALEIGQERLPAVFQKLEAGANNDSPVQIATLNSYDDMIEQMAQTRYLLSIASLLGISICALAICTFVIHINKPLRALSETAEAVGKGDFTQTMLVASNDEWGNLAKSFNRMTSNLRDSRAKLQTTVAELQETQGQLMQREERLRESEEGLSLIVEGAQDHVIFTIDYKHRVLRWNNAAEFTLGYSTEEAQDLPYYHFFDDEDVANGVPETLLKTAESIGRASFEGWRKRKDGSRFWADVTISRLNKISGSKHGGFVEIARDITTRKEAEIAMREARDAAESSNRAKSEFLANMSHEFRTPMNGIIGMTNLLGSMDLTTEQREFVDTIRVSADSLLAIIEDILDIAKIEAGRFDIERDDINFPAYLEEIIRFFAPLCHEKGLSLNLVLDRNLPDSLNTDGGRLRQILVNLVANAIKFTEQGGIIIRAAGDIDHSTISITVEDTGIGIESEKIERLFKPFFQVESSASRKFGGTGLGLAISKNIAQLLGGDIYVRSQIGEGSTFTFKFETESQISNPHLHLFDGKNALIISDSALSRTTFAEQMAFWKAAPTAIPSDSEEVEATLNAGENDLIIVDKSSCSSETLQRIAEGRDKEPDQFPAIVNIVADSAKAESEERSDTASVLTAPIRPSELNREVERLLRARQHRTQNANKEHQNSSGSTKSSQTISRRKTKKKTYDSKFANKFPLRLLVVEDNPINTKVLVNTLHKLGYYPDSVENGEEGLKAAESVQYDTILMDLQMPVMDGLDSARYILNSTAIKHPIYISAFTANTHEKDREACKDVGMHDFVAKPARANYIMEMLKRAHQWIQENAGIRK